jgi:hypothetical protein
MIITKNTFDEVILPTYSILKDHISKKVHLTLKQYWKGDFQQSEQNIFYRREVDNHFVK